MKRLVVMRHAKAVSDSPHGDHARGLTERGRSDTALVGRRLVELGWCPDQVLSSDAARTRETWDRLADVLGEGPGVTFSRRLYLAGPAEIADAALELDPDARTVLLLGHNPGWEQLVAQLCGEGLEMPTASAVLLTAPDGRSWAQALSSPGWSLVDQLRARSMR